MIATAGFALAFWFIAYTYPVFIFMVILFGYCAGKSDLGRLSFKHVSATALGVFTYTKVSILVCSPIESIE